MGCSRVKKSLYLALLILVVLAFAACSDLSFLHRGFGFIPGSSPAPGASGPAAIIIVPRPSATPAETHTLPPSPTISLPDIGGYVPTQAELDIIAQINTQREAERLSKFTVDNKLCGIAHVKAQEMYDRSYFAHTSPTYGSMSDMLHSFSVKFSSMGENIARIADPARLVDAWMDSQDHRQNILNERCKKVGVGIAGNYYVAVFTD